MMTRGNCIVDVVGVEGGAEKDNAGVDIAADRKERRSLRQLSLEMRQK